MIPMQQSFDFDAIQGVSFLCGDKENIEGINRIEVLKPFEEDILLYLDDVSKELMKNRAAREYPDVITFAFWIRRASMLKLKEKYCIKDFNVHLGRGIVFHIAPSNVAVNYAYSLVAGLVTGNINIVRIPSKNFAQVELINAALIKCLESHSRLYKYINLVRYDRSKKVNDCFSAIADVRIIWGGDSTIFELRKSPLKPRATEITFADRYSISVIDSDSYMCNEDKENIANAFYNDTYLTDQNACTSPRLVVWHGNRICEARDEFWHKLDELAVKKYTLQPIQSINKLTDSYEIAAVMPGAKVVKGLDNTVFRVELSKLQGSIMEMKGNSGFFMEYTCESIVELQDICNDLHCQTIGYIGNLKDFEPLLNSGIKGVDRIVPIGKTMDFDLIWDGYNLVERLTRTVVLRNN